MFSARPARVLTMAAAVASLRASEFSAPAKVERLALWTH